MIKLLLMCCLLSQAGASLVPNKSKVSYKAKLGETKTELVFKIKNTSNVTRIINKWAFFFCRQTI